jgi:hypothetical protein
MPATDPYTLVIDGAPVKRLTDDGPEVLGSTAHRDFIVSVSWERDASWTEDDERRHIERQIERTLVKGQSASDDIVLAQVDVLGTCGEAAA